MYNQDPYQGQQGYPQQGGYAQQYPPQGYPQQQGYPVSQGYPPQGYAPPAGYGYDQGYPPQQGYPQQQGYPPQNQGYPPQTQAYPPQNQAYPPQAQGYPPQQAYAPAGYPQQAGPAVQEVAAVLQQVPAAAVVVVPVNTLVVPGVYCATFDAAGAANRLRAAMKGLGTDNKELVREIAPLDYIQVKMLKEAYTQLHQRDLIKDIESETSGNYKHALKSFLMNPAEFDAYELHDAMAGLGTNHKLLDQIMATRTFQEKLEIKEHFHRHHNRDLEKWIEGDTSGHYEKLLLALLNVPRAVGVDPTRTQLLVDELYKAGEGKIGTDEKKFTEIFTKESIEQLREVFLAYPMSHKNHSMEHAVKSEFSGKSETLLLDIVHFVLNPAEFWADALHGAMKGLGTNDKDLILIIVSQRDRIGEIDRAFKKKNAKDLINWIQGDTSGNYKEFLIDVVKAHIGRF